MKTINRLIALFRSGGRSGKAAAKPQPESGRFHWAKKCLAIMTLGVCSLVLPAHAAGLLVPSNATGNTSLQIKSHDISVTVENGFAITSVDQVFHNPQANDLEATYRFPVPDKGAVSEFTVWIDNQPVIGEVLEKAQARTVYQEEKAAGREAGLAEKNKHYSFELKVTPVRAGQDTRIRLVYMQAVDIDTGIGRYVYPLENGQTDDAANAFWLEETAVQEHFAFNLNLRSANPVSGLRLPAHPQAAITKTDDQQWQVSMVNTAMGTENSSAMLESAISENDGVETEAIPVVASTQAGIGGSLDTDIVVYWRLAPNTPASVDLVAHKEADKNTGTFMLTLTPGDDLKPITAGRDWVFVLDMSGSMQGKYASLVDGVQRALGTLTNQDRFRIVRFSNHAEELTRGWIVASASEVTHWSQKLGATQTGGGTNLYGGIGKGLSTLDADRTSVIVLVTDGEANVGVTEKKEFLKLMEKKDVRLFTAVMGNGANRPLLEAMTEVSNGFATSVSNSDDIVGKLMKFTSKVTHEAMHDIDLKISGVTTRDLTPKVTRTLYRGEQLTVFGHYKGSGEAEVSLRAKVSGESKTYKTRFNFPDQDVRNPEIERLWAYASIRDMQDMMDYLGDESEHRSAIVDTAVQYGLVTDYTSMVVMRNEQFTARNIERKNQARRNTETTAAQQRALQPVQNNRVDQSTPAFNKPAPTYRRSSGGSGGGSMGLESLFLTLMMLPLVVVRCVRRRAGSMA